VSEPADERGHERDDLLWRHLKSLPAFRALLRAVEARFYRAVEIPGPVLDLGCGDGHFAQMAFDEPLAAGADPWWGPLQKARRTGAYRLNVQALGDALPFASGAFASVISNSVLEHIDDVQPVLVEASRVLRPGGRLVITMPSHRFTANLAGARWLGRIGLGDAYRRFFNTISRHAHTDPPEEWAARLASAGFQIRRWQSYFSPGALRALEIGHVQGLPSAAIHFLTGHWILGPWHRNLQATERWLRPYYEEPPTEAGAYLFFVAEKVGDAPVAVALPPAQFFDVNDLQEPDATGTPPAPLPTRAPLPAAPAPPRQAQAPAARLLPDGLAPARTGRTTAQLALLAAALFFGLLAQRVLSSHPAEPWTGVRLYLLSFLALAALILQRRQPGRSLLPRWDTVQPQRLLYPLALLLALWAQQLGGRSWLALPLWLAAIAVAYYALRAAGLPRPAILHVPPWRALLAPALLFGLALVPRLVSLAGHPFVVNGAEASLGLDALAIAAGRGGNPFATGWLTNPTLPLLLQAIPLALLGPSAVSVRLLPALIGAATVPLLFLFGRRIWCEAVGVVAALLLLGGHWHVHYSRLGMTNIWDPLLALLAASLLILARQEGTRRAWLAAGMAVGATAYIYTASHLIPILLVALFLYFIAIDRPALGQARHMIAGLALAAVVALPQLRFYLMNPGIYMERAHTLGVVETGWLANEAANSGRSLLDLVGWQLSQAALAFNYSLDTASYYNPGRPLLSFWPALLFVFGSGVAILRGRQLRYALLLLWFSVTVVVAGALLLDPPASHRLLFAAPAVYLLAALGLVEIVRVATAAVQRPLAVRQMLALLAGLAVLIAAADLFFYFGPYRAAYRFGDRNTEIADQVAAYLSTLPAGSVVYFHGPPVMYADFPTITFLAPQFRPGENLFNVEDPAAALPVQSDALVFIYIPERSAELAETQARLPGGRVQTFPGHLANPLFYAYELQR
jgi:SAM-dependent methyltransferase